MKNSIKFYDYNLPSNLIAENPRPKREHAKLMIYDQELDTLNHSIFSNLDEYLTKGDLIIPVSYTHLTLPTICSV